MKIKSKKGAKPNEIYSSMKLIVSIRQEKMKNITKCKNTATCSSSQMLAGALD
jgi:hypothetical protein